MKDLKSLVRIMSNSLAIRILTIGILCFFSSVSLNISLNNLPPPQFSFANPRFANADVLRLLKYELGNANLALYLAVALLSVLYSKFLFSREIGFDYASLLVGFVFSIFSVLGISFSKFKDFSFIAGTSGQFVIATITFLGFLAIYYCLLKIVYFGIDKINRKEREHQFHCPSFLCGANVYPILFALVSTALLLCWLIQVLPFLPGSVPHDSREQLLQFYGFKSYTLQHPLVSTWLMGWLHRLSSFVAGGDSPLVYVLVQSFFAATVFGYACMYVLRKTRLPWLAGAIFLFYAFAPFWPSYVETTLKDTPFFLWFTLFIVLTVKVYFDEVNSLTFLFLVICSIFCCLFRYGTLLVILPTLLLLYFLKRNFRRKLIFSILIIAFSNFVANTFVPWCYELKYPSREALSLPLQSAARLVTLHRDHIERRDLTVIGKVLNLDETSRLYNPEVADPIKFSNLRKSATARDKKEFLKVLGKYLFRFPKTYLESVLNGSFGYFYPFYYPRYRQLTQSYTKDFLSNYDKEIIFSKYWFPASLQRYEMELVALWDLFPPFSLLVSPAFFAWLLLVCAGNCLRAKDYMKLILIVSPSMIFLICIASPANGLVRYFLPVMATAPILFSVICFGSKTKSASDKSQTKRDRLVKIRSLQ